MVPCTACALLTSIAEFSLCRPILPEEGMEDRTSRRMRVVDCDTGKIYTTTSIQLAPSLLHPLPPPPPALRAPPPLLPEPRATQTHARSSAKSLAIVGASFSGLALARRARDMVRLPFHASIVGTLTVSPSRLPNKGFHVKIFERRPNSVGVTPSL